MGLVLVAAVSACASSKAPLNANRDPYSDPSKFESLASNAYEMPVAPVVATQPVATPALSLLEGASLVSPAVAFTDDKAANRAPASTSDAAYTNLIRGNERFVNGSTKGERRDSVRRRGLASSENPFAVVLSCSDSRVPPELIFDQGLGDLFTIRVAGNVLGSAQVASIEHAVDKLGAKLIVVMGHESCDAVKAALSPAGEKRAKAGSTDLDWLVGSIRPALKSRGLASINPEDPALRKPVMANIDSVTDNLMVRSKIISSAIQSGNLKVVRGIYSLDSGRVDFWGLK
jgi:carbonic anhydrase